MTLKLIALMQATFSGAKIILFYRRCYVGASLARGGGSIGISGARRRKPRAVALPYVLRRHQERGKADVTDVVAKYLRSGDVSGVRRLGIEKKRACGNSWPSSAYENVVMK